jgi:hypothetical protein
VTTWYVFEGFSRIENLVVKRFQSLSFCAIISLLIIGSVFIGEKKLAFAGAVLEGLINFYYYARDFWENGFKNFSGKAKEKKKKRKESVIRFWRKYWLKFVFGAIIPAGIYICAELMMKFV